MGFDSKLAAIDEDHSGLPEDMLRLLLWIFLRGYGALVGYFVNHPLYTPPSKFCLQTNFFSIMF